MIRLAPAVAVALLSAAPALAQPVEPWWQRGWIAAAMDCPRCSPDLRRYQMTYMGRTITFAPGHFDNPLYESCSRPDYAEITPRPRAEVEQTFRGLWPMPRLTADRPLAGMVICVDDRGDRHRLGYFVFDAPDRAYYRWEGGTVVTLR